MRKKAKAANGMGPGRAMIVRRPETKRSKPVPEAPKALTSFCWCGRKYVEVSAEDVRRGRTVSCGLPRCAG